jgi:WD40 repeat protein
MFLNSLLRQVSWSMSTPYQLITTGADGLARVWDIRKACLKRYKTFVGNRAEYTRNLPKAQKANNPVLLSDRDENRSHDDSSTNDATLPTIDGHDDEVPLPPLPPAPGVEGIPVVPQIDNLPDSGHFVANNRIDEGVKLLSKLQHGSPPDGIDSSVPGTRSRLSTVKVICVAQCPKGGHFATGSDDGACVLCLYIRFFTCVRRSIRNLSRMERH